MQIYERIPHSRPTLPQDDEWPGVLQSLASGWAADGPCVERFSAVAARWFGGVGAVAVNSGTNALHLALLAAGVRPGQDVLVPAYSCAALLNAVAQANARPVLVDTEPGGFNLSSEAARSKVSAKTGAVVVAHLFGHPAPVDRFLELGVPVIEDCAQSLGSVDRGILTGGRAPLSIGSFYATKVITTGHGGLVSTTSPELLETLRQLLDYDNRDDWEPRFSYRMGELPAALGLWQLERLPAWLDRRRALADYFDGCLTALGFQPPAGAPRDTGDARGLTPNPNFYRYVLRVASAERVMRTLQSVGVDAKRPVYRPLHHYLGGEYPGAEAAHAQIVSLPIHPSLTDAQAERVVEALSRLAPEERAAPGCD